MVLGKQKVCVSEPLFFIIYKPWLLPVCKAAVITWNFFLHATVIPTKARGTAGVVACKAASFSWRHSPENAAASGTGQQRSGAALQGSATRGGERARPALHSRELFRMCSARRLPVQRILGLGDGVPALWLRAQPLSKSWLLHWLPDSACLCCSSSIHQMWTAVPTLKRCFEKSTETTQEALCRVSGT